MHLISFCKITWGPVSIRAVLDNQGIGDFLEHSIPGLEGSRTNALRQKGEGKQSKNKAKQNKTSVISKEYLQVKFKWVTITW